MPRRRKGWPSAEAVEHWEAVEAYFPDCYCREFVVASRQWARAVAAGEREIYSTVYAYAVRQLKYNDTDKGLAIGLIRAAMASYDRT